jgi:predicted nucleic acid-binding protein
MYLVGAPHPNREALVRFLREHASESYVSSAEVYQEIIHRGVALDRRPMIAAGFELLDELVERVLPITRRDTERAREIAEAQRRLSARDCLHLAVMESQGIDRVLTFDRDFGLWPGVTCLP